MKVDGTSRIVTGVDVVTAITVPASLAAAITAVGTAGMGSVEIAGMVARPTRAAAEKAGGTLRIRAGGDAATGIIARVTLAVAITAADTPGTGDMVEADMVIMDSAVVADIIGSTSRTAVGGDAATDINARVSLAAAIMVVGTAGTVDMVEADMVIMDSAVVADIIGSTSRTAADEVGV